MRTLIITTLAVLVTSLAAPVAAQPNDADAVRRELEQMRKNFEAMRDEYQKQMDAMAERLRRLEAQPAPTAAPPPTAAQVAPPPPSPTGGAGVQAPPAPRQHHGPAAPARAVRAYGTTPPGSCCSTSASPAISSAPGQRNVEKAGAGTFRAARTASSRASRAQPVRQIDPYARGEVRIEMAEEARGQETAVSLAEAHLTLLTLPFNTQLKLGQMRTRTGGATSSMSTTCRGRTAPACIARTSATKRSPRRAPS